MTEMRWIVVALVVSGCRINFDPLGTADADANALDSTDAVLVVPGLVALYTMESLATPASMVPDVVGGHHASCSTATCPTPVAGHTGSAVQFDGTMRLQVTSAPDLVLPAGYTVGVWIQAANLTINFQTVVNKKSLGVTGDTWALAVVQKRATFYSNFTGRAADQLQGATDLDMQWHHIAVRWDGAQKSVWLDGVLDGVSAEPANEFTASPINLGADQISGGAINAAFTGLADDIAIYGRALTDVEMAAIAR
jgi:hypothetical protein